MIEEYMHLGLYKIRLKYLEETYVKISDFKVAAAVSQTCEEYSVCLYMNLQLLALKQLVLHFAVQKTQ